MTTKLFGFDVIMHPTGSKYICNPPVEDTDEDYIVFVAPKYFEDIINEALDNGCDFDGSDISPAEDDVNVREFDFPWNSVRDGDKNYIITSSKEFYNKFVNATKLAKCLNLLDKNDRIRLFQAVLYDNYDWEEPSDFEPFVGQFHISELFKGLKV